MAAWHQFWQNGWNKPLRMCSHMNAALKQSAPPIKWTTHCMSICVCTHRAYLDVKELKDILKVDGSTHLNIFFANSTNEDLAGVATWPWDKEALTHLGNKVYLISTRLRTNELLLWSVPDWVSSWRYYWYNCISEALFHFLWTPQCVQCLNCTFKLYTADSLHHLILSKWVVGASALFELFTPFQGSKKGNPNADW